MGFPLGYRRKPVPSHKKLERPKGKYGITVHRVNSKTFRGYLDVMKAEMKMIASPPSRRVSLTSDNLPIEKILSFLDLSSLCQCLLVCKAWRAAASSCILLKKTQSKSQDTLEEAIELQNRPCSISTKTAMCLECSKGKSAECRFIGFRKNISFDFLLPQNARMEDLQVWNPFLKESNKLMTIASARYIIMNVGPYYYDILQEQKDIYNSCSEKVIWKPAMKGMREVCDTCCTSLFNLHWCCRNCGFSICHLCYQDFNSSKRLTGLCSFYEDHSFTLAQILPGNSLEGLEEWVVALQKLLSISPEFEMLHSRMSTDKESRMNTAPHSWMCNGKILCLEDPRHPGNYKLFREQLTSCLPVVIARVTSTMQKSLWSPQAFCEDFGDEVADLVSCSSGIVHQNKKMRGFWETFSGLVTECKSDGNEKPDLFKLKDWPPRANFSEIMPLRYKDFMEALPLAMYTHHDGPLNLVSHLPEFFLRPDLGPKLYVANGSTTFATCGTTNLHIDMSDAINVLVYSSPSPNSINNEACQDAGALWHIFKASDAEKIRSFLRKKRKQVSDTDDPIHDQSWYLDSELQTELKRDCGVEGFRIYQCVGDSIYIPAGCPHQVLNLKNCIKVAEDFVSPENLSVCLSLTQEFRKLSSSHSNHEDKLQVRNIIYHALKEAVSTIVNHICEGK